jgi:hypothetical protein
LERAGRVSPAIVFEKCHCVYRWWRSARDTWDSSHNNRQARAKESNANVIPGTSFTDRIHDVEAFKLDFSLKSFTFVNPSRSTFHSGIKRTSNRFELGVALRTPILKAAISRFASLFYLVTAALE